MNTPKRSRVRREVIAIPDHNILAGMFGTAPILGDTTAIHRLAWTIYEPGRTELSAALPTHRDAMNYAQTLARRRLAQKWGTQ